jgi:predicted ATPase
MVEAVQKLLHLRAVVEPVLLVIEDLHWLDPASRQVIESLAESLTAARLALLVNFRPEFAHGWAGLGHYRQLRVEPLSANGAQALLDRLLGQHPSMAPLRCQLATRAGGNPFFLEECVRAAAGTPGLLAEAPGAYRLVGDPDAVVLPTTVQAVIGARIDRLAPEDKRLLQVASVIGTEPPAALLRAVSGLPEEAFEASLARLQSGEFLVPLRLVPDVAYRFRHALTHEVAYGSLLRQDRRELHLRVLRAMAPRDGAEPPVEILAFHATRAEAWEAAADYGRQAGMQAAARSANREALRPRRARRGVLAELRQGPGAAGRRWICCWRSATRSSCWASPRRFRRIWRKPRASPRRSAMRSAGRGSGCCCRAGTGRMASMAPRPRRPTGPSRRVATRCWSHSASTGAGPI